MLQWSEVDVTTWPVVAREKRGTAEKFWISDSAGVKWLRKSPRENRGSECAIEILVLSLARLAGLDPATAQPAIWSSADGVQRGVVVCAFLDEREEFSMGSQVLPRGFPQYDQENDWAQTPERARAALLEVGKGVNVDLVTPFARMLFFDAWVGNCDRHQENWGIIREASGSNVRLAPMFDPAACLGGELHDTQPLLDSGAPPRRYIERCPSGFGDGKDKISMAELVKQIRTWPE